jgi:hypothetical protein
MCDHVRAIACEGNQETHMHTSMEVALREQASDQTCIVRGCKRLSAGVVQLIDSSPWIHGMQQVLTS